MERGKILDRAKEIINKDRQDAYGNPEDCFGLISKYWSIYLEYEISEKEVSMMMALLKIAREQMNHKQDNLIDACGYLALADDLINQTKKRHVD